MSLQRLQDRKLFTLVGINERRWLDDERRKCHRDSTNAVADRKSLLMGSKRGSEKVVIRRDPQEQSGSRVYPGFVFYSESPRDLWGNDSQELVDEVLEAYKRRREKKEIFLSSLNDHTWIFEDLCLRRQISFVKIVMYYWLTYGNAITIWAFPSPL